MQNTSTRKLHWLVNFNLPSSLIWAFAYQDLGTSEMERVKFQALKSANDNFETRMTLPATVKEDLLWWRDVFEDTSQRNVIRSGLFRQEIFTDASLTGWGAVCDDTRTHGYWSTKDKQNHINYLELFAIFHALKCFASHAKNCDILLRVDNVTALSYVNRIGSIKFPHLSNLARKIWCWCAERNLFIYASYIPSAQNFGRKIPNRFSRNRVGLGGKLFR